MVGLEYCGLSRKYIMANQGRRRGESHKVARAYNSKEEYEVCLVLGIILFDSHLPIGYYPTVDIAYTLYIRYSKKVSPRQISE